MNQIQYITGDATNPIGEGNKIICHVCNNIGGWGAGFVLALSKKWPIAEADYREWFRRGEFYGNKFQLGNIDLVRVSDITKDTREVIHVCNMIAQIKTIRTNPKPIDYDAVRMCLEKAAKAAIDLKSSIHMPRIGCGLAGGKWEVIEKIINETLITKDIPVYVYSIKNDKSWQ